MLLWTACAAPTELIQMPCANLQGQKCTERRGPALLRMCCTKNRCELGYQRTSRKLIMPNACEAHLPCYSPENFRQSFQFGCHRYEKASEPVCDPWRLITRAERAQERRIEVGPSVESGAKS